MKIFGEGHLAEVLRAEMRLYDICIGDLAFIAYDIIDHGDERALCAAANQLYFACADYPCVVVLSQVPPGWTRAHIPAGTKASVFYQADTIIVRQAVARMLRPEQFIIGCADPSQPLPIPYQAYLAFHDCPIHQMSYESAELAKCAINYALAAQIETANRLFAIAGKVGANYADVERALHRDCRIGPHAYLSPGGTNQHLDRDAFTLGRLLCSP